MGHQDKVIEGHVLRQLGQLFHAGHGALRADGDISAVRADGAQHHLDQRGFPAAVDADKADMILRPNLKRYVGKQKPVSKLFPYLYNIHDSHTFPYAV